jgi:hypothetical protein
MRIRSLVALVPKSNYATNNEVCSQSGSRCVFAVETIDNREPFNWAGVGRNNHGVRDAAPHAFPNSRPERPIASCATISVIIGRIPDGGWAGASRRIAERLGDWHLARRTDRAPYPRRRRVTERWRPPAGRNYRGPVSPHIIIVTDQRAVQAI